MTQKAKKITRELLSFIEKSPTAFSAVDTISEELDRAGYQRLCECDGRVLAPGSYYATRNGSSLIAFRIPKKKCDSFMIAASHSDSPTFKLKPLPECDAFGVYKKLNTECYGGMLMASWFDRPLSVAGRLIVKNGDLISAKTVVVDKDLLMIPSVAIHFDRTANDGKKYNPASDTQPFYGMKGAESIKEIAAASIGVDPADVIGEELFLYCRTPGTVFGVDDAFFAAPRIDNLMCAFTSMKAFLCADRDTAIPVFAMFDNEETGSETKQGAASAFLHDTLAKIAVSNGSDLSVMLASSMMLSMDNGHARHPNHPELSDPENAPHLNGGVVLKYNASQRYTTDGISAALFREICQREKIPVQTFANRSDVRGGSTLGSISNTRVPLCTVDIGAAQLAMHSAYETAGTEDTLSLFRAAKAFFETKVTCVNDGVFRLS